MRRCCPPGEGCNAPGLAETCALTRLRAARDGDGDRALTLWGRYQAARGRRERRFLRRAYERARDRALGPWTPWDAGAAITVRRSRPRRHPVLR